MGGKGFSRDQLSRVIKSLLAYSGQDRSQAVSTAVDIAASWIEDKGHDHKNVLADPDIWRLIRSLIQQAIPEQTMDVYHWSNLLRAASAIEPALAVSKCIEALLEGLYVSEQAADILATIARAEPELVMAELGRVVLDEESGWKLQMRGITGLLCALPADTVLAWLNQHGAVAARKIASSLPRPFLSAEGEPKLPALTEKTLERFGNDEKVKQRFAMRADFRSYSGNIVGQHLEEAKFAEKFLNYPIEAVRFWAQTERERALDEAERWKQHIAEERW
jgi:hypothetical protein